jgi:CDP-diacylglycerol---glycerol-3-phosphate 3-phosphatidyltransferase
LANLITLARLLLLFVAIFIIYHGSPIAYLINVLILIVVFVSDGLDGYVARKRGESSLFGAVFDIAADRTVELCLWVVFAHLSRIPVWIPLIFIARGVITDAIRASESQAHATTPFSMMQSPLAKMLVAGRFMRGFYATLKGFTFGFLMLALALESFTSPSVQHYGEITQQIGLLLAYLSLLICLVRGIPVVVEFIQKEASKP